MKVKIRHIWMMGAAVLALGFPRALQAAEPEFEVVCGYAARSIGVMGMNRVEADINKKLKQIAENWRILEVSPPQSSAAQTNFQTCVTIKKEEK